MAIQEAGADVFIIPCCMRSKLKSFYHCQKVITRFYKEPFARDDVTIGPVGHGENAPLSKAVNYLHLPV